MVIAQGFVERKGIKKEDRWLCLSCLAVLVIGKIGKRYMSCIPGARSPEIIGTIDQRKISVVHPRDTWHMIKHHHGFDYHYFKRQGVFCPLH
jgi:hypothetical protein